MNKPIDYLPALMQHLVNGDLEAWRTHWEAKGQPWRTMPEIDEERQRDLVQRLTIVPSIEKGIYPFRDLKLSRADVEWLLVVHSILCDSAGWGDERGRECEGLDLRGADLRGEDLSGLPLMRIRGGLTVKELGNTTSEQRDMAGVHLEGANLIRSRLEGALLYGAHLEETNLIEAHLEEAFLCEAHLEKSNLFQSHLHRANLSFAHLEEANLIKAHLERANLSFAHLERAVFSEAFLDEANLIMAHLEGANLSRTHLEGARLQRASLDSTSILEDAILSDGKCKFASLADVRWSGANLTVVDWSSVQMLGDEYGARQRREHGKRVKNKAERLGEHKAAVHANRQLALVLRSQGMNEDADHFAYRAQLLQRVVWRGQRKLLKYAFSWLLYLLAGYGYRPLRGIFIYLFVILSFAGGYSWATHALHAQPYPLSYYEALVLSISSFHGRGFFQPVGNLGDPVAFLAAMEAVFGFLIEISFVATFTQRYFGK